MAHWGFGTHTVDLDPVLRARLARAVAETCPEFAEVSGTFARLIGCVPSVKGLY